MLIALCVGVIVRNEVEYVGGDEEEREDLWRKENRNPSAFGLLVLDDCSTRPAVFDGSLMYWPIRSSAPLTDMNPLAPQSLQLTSGMLTLEILSSKEVREADANKDAINYWFNCDLIVRWPADLGLVRRLAPTVMGTKGLI